VLRSCEKLDSATLVAKVHVASDGSTDQTCEIARAFPGVDVVEYVNRGKWKTIRALAAEVGSSPDHAPDWIAFADSGIEWPEDFLAGALPLLQTEDIAAVAPTYRATKSGLIETTVWSIERHFKTLETTLGGPVSIHGATILYRTKAVLEIFEALGDGVWLNDDVVLPLMLRARFPEHRIVYAPHLAVSDSLDAPKGVAGSAYRRRRRLVLGNLQWITGILPDVARRNRIAALMALRRVFRVLWAYWGLSFAVTGSLWLASTAPVIFMITIAFTACTLVAALRVRSLGGLVASASASLLAPYYFFSNRGGKSEFGQAAWK